MSDASVQNEEAIVPTVEILPTAGTSGDAPRTHYDRSSIRMAEVSEAVAIVRNGEGKPFAGRHVYVAADGVTLIAAAAGRVHQDAEGRVHVDTALEVPGNVDFSTGNIDFPGDVIVHGSVLDLFKVQSKGSVFVDGTIEAAEIHAVGDLQANGGIVGKERGVCSIGGSLHARYVTNARVQAGGSVECAVALANCQLISGGQVTVSHGPIVAGQVIATGGISCMTLGGPAGVMTIVEAGVDDVLRNQLPQIISHIEAQRQKAKKIEQTVQPLLANQKALTAAQKEKATELLFDAQEMADAATRSIEAIRKRHADVTSRARPQVEVHGTLHPGVIIRFPGFQTRITSPFKGPLKICLKKTDRDTRIVLVDLQSGASQQLGAESLPDKVASSMNKLAAA